MRKNNPIVIAVLALVLLLGAGAGIWVLMNPGGESGNMQAKELEDGKSNNSDSGNPLDGDGKDTPGPDDSGTNDPANKDTGNNPGESNKNPGENGGEKDNTTTNKNPGENPGENPDVATTEYEAATTKFVIHGRVTMKSDGRPGVGAGVKVEIFQGPRAAGMWGQADAIARAYEDDSRPKPQLTAEDAVTDGAGEYSISVSYKTWHPKLAGGQDPNERNAVRQWDRAPLIVVASMPGYAPARSNEIRPTADSDHEVNLKLAIPAAITGRVIDAVSREGVPGATGRLQDSDAWRDGGSAPYSFTSDANGYFSLNGLPASNYTINVNAQGYAEYGGWEKGRVNLTGGGEKDLGEIPLLRSASVIGRIIDESGKPLANATAQLVKNQQWGGWATSEATSGEDGRFEMTDVEPGTYTVKANAQGLGNYKKDGVTIEAAGQTDLGDLIIGKGLEVSGVVVDTSNQPVSGATVGLKESSSNFGWGDWGPPSITGTTDAEGAFTLTGATEASWVLTVTMEGYAVHRETLQLKKSATGLKIKLSAGGSISGRVLNADGSAVSQITVSATSHTSQAYSSWKTMPEQMWGTLFGRQDMNTTTDADGNFLIEHVPEGTYLVAASNMEDGAAYEDSISVKDNNETRDVVIRFAGKGTARVTVTENGAAVPDLKVSLSKNIGWVGQGGHTSFTDTMGLAEIKEVPAGTWYVMTERDEGNWDTDSSKRRVVVKEGETVEFNLELRPQGGVTLHGRLTLNGKVAFSDVMLIGTGQRAEVMKNQQLVEGGFYEFVGLKTGKYVLHARTSDTDITARVTLNLDEEGDHPFDKDFVGYNVSGTVTTPENSPAQLASVSVALQHAEYERAELSNWLRGRTSAGANGTFSFSGVTPGTYVLSASLDGVGTVSSSITVGNSDQTGLALSIAQNSGSIKLTVSKLNGTPVSGNSFGMVNLTQTDGTPVDLGESFQGWFMLNDGATQTIPTVEPGTYNLHLQGSGFLPVVLKNVSVSNGEQSEVSTELTAAAELHVTFTNPEVTQEMIDEAVVRYYDASGVEVPVETNVFDSWGAPPPPEVPTVVAKYLGQNVTEVRVKLAGYAELVISVEFTPGKKIAKEESAVAE